LVVAPEYFLAFVVNFPLGLGVVTSLTSEGNFPFGRGVVTGLTREGSFFLFSAI